MAQDKIRQAGVDSPITEQVREWIGRSSEPLALPEGFLPTDVRRYIDATGDANPLWLDDEFARRAGYRSRVVPPVVVLESYRRYREAEARDALNVWREIPLPENYTDTRNAGSEIEWLGPVYPDDRLIVQHRIADILARQGKAGLGIYVTRETAFQNQEGKVVARLKQTTVKLPRPRASAGAGPKEGG